MQLSPIKFSIIGNQLSLNGVNTELMEGNSYPVEIETNEDLDIGYNLYIKPYGTQDVTSIGELINDPVRLVKVACTIQDAKGNENKKNYWGYLKANLEEGYRAILLDYEPIEEPSVIPKKNKIVDYKTVEIGYIDFTYNQKEKTEKFKNPTLILNNLKQDETVTIDTYEILNDLNQALLPPLIDGKIVVSETIIATTLKKELSIITRLSSQETETEDISNEEFYQNDDGNDELPKDSDSDFFITNTNLTDTIIEENSLDDEDKDDLFVEDFENRDETDNEEILDEDSLITLIGTIELINKNFNLSSYNSEAGLYIYKTEIIEPTSIISNNLEFTDIKFTGTVLISFNENNFGDYFVNLAGTVTAKKDNQDIDIDCSIEVNNSIFSNDIIDFSGFGFNKESLSDFLPIEPPREFVNLYTTTIPIEYLTVAINNFKLGVGKKENGSFSYSTNSIEFSVYSSMISSTNWEFGSFVAPENLYALGYFVEDSNGGKFYKPNIKETIEKTEIEILGRTNVLYIDITEAVKHTTATDVLKNLKFYAWEPFGSFYQADSFEEYLKEEG